VTDLNLAEFIKDPEAPSMFYDLVAVTNHYGSMGGGHYTAYAKNHIANKWYEFNDSRVSSISPRQIVTPAAYVLFYQRKHEASN
jgi:ubiquitin carboxyl-terminal hydrolase 4/11/15